MAATTAWNFQQGAMLQWHPAAADSQLIYNTRDGDAFRGCDLHPRWNRSGGCVTFDSLHEGFRGIYQVEADVS